ncbi:MAG: hypothetical protein KIT02_05045 [Devosia sp.]|uniref:hypothetical protein n=1 Tax=Devosia sp. TaxID=1871048 RepID=UPI0024CA61D5|nr:hypothetical protein [Devosia sp.]UYO00584.1 MAG: hypothetical protein KIT02_05045 [Devosia sp.]
MISTGTEQAQTRSSGTIAYNLAAIAVMISLIAVGGAYLIDRAVRADGIVGPELSDVDPISQTIGGRELSIPANWYRHGEQLKPGFAAQADIIVRLGLSEGAAPVPVEVTLLPRTRARASSGLLDAVYLHQFEDGTIGGVPGLVGKRLISRDGYAGESVWYDALSPDPFVAKCLDPISDTTVARCVRTVQLPSGLAAIYTFDATALPFWRQFDTAMANWLERAGAL